MEEINIFEIQQLEGALGGVAGVARQAENALGSLDAKLLTLRLNFGKLRAAVERAFAPVTSHVATALNGMVRGLTDFVNDAGAVIAALFGTVQEKAVVTAGKTGKALRRSLADFDEIQRLNGGSGGSGGSTVTWKTVTQPLTPELQKTVDAIRALFEPLRAVSFDKAKAALASLGQALAELGRTAGESLSWAWHNLFVPLAKWTIEAAVPGAVHALSAALSTVSAAISPVLAGIKALLPAFQPVAAFLGSAFLGALNLLREGFTQLTAAFSAAGSGIESAMALAGRAVSGLLAAAAPVLTALRETLFSVFSGFGTYAAGAVQSLLTALGGITTFLSGAFTGNWSKAWSGLKTVLKAAVNGIIGLLNGLLTALVGGINAAVRQLNRLRVELPGWLPGIGGKSFGISIPTLSVPQIPYLAKGAVLPANAPFLAVVGDQKHGTNIEAPLSTIQEAVASVLLPGQNEANQLLAQLIAAVSGIRVGDDTIGRAAQRWSRQRLLTEGGF